jgi:beta-lactamase class A
MLNIKFYLCLFFTFIIGLSVSYIAHDNIDSVLGQKDHLLPFQIPQEQVRQGGYSFISPLLECESSSELTRAKMIGFKNNLSSKVNQLIKDNDAKMVSVYFRDLNNGPWYGINEDETFTPASLLKAPLMMALLKQAESDPSFLSKNIQISDDESEADMIPQDIKPADPLIPGGTYTIEDLIYHMIVYSDNHAMQLLLGEINQDVYNKVYTDLDIHLPSASVQENYMTVKEYAGFFRILYNASYLNKEMSEKALKILSEVDYKDGLVAGLPKNVVVSHKFGERTYDNNDTKQLHDCGIVYHPQSPYLLCVMSRGNSLIKEAKVISEVSKFVYDEVNNYASK